MSHTRRQHRAHTQTQTHRTHPKPRIRLTAPTRQTTTSPASPTPIPLRRRNHLSVHSPIHQPISLIHQPISFEDPAVLVSAVAAVDAALSADTGVSPTGPAEGA